MGNRLSMEQVNQLLETARYASNNAITETSSLVFIQHDEMFGDVDIRGEGWLLTIDNSMEGASFEASVMAVACLCEGLGQLLESGEYRQRILKESGGTQETSIGKIQEEYKSCVRRIQETHFTDDLIEGTERGYKEGLLYALRMLNRDA